MRERKYGAYCYSAKKVAEAELAWFQKEIDKINKQVQAYEKDIPEDEFQSEESRVLWRQSTADDIALDSLGTTMEGCLQTLRNEGHFCSEENMGFAKERLDRTIKRMQEKHILPKSLPFDFHSFVDKSQIAFSRISTVNCAELFSKARTDPTLNVNTLENCLQYICTIFIANNWFARAAKIDPQPDSVLKEFLEADSETTAIWNETKERIEARITADDVYYALDMLCLLRDTSALVSNEKTNLTNLVEQNLQEFYVLLIWAYLIRVFGDAYDACVETIKDKDAIIQKLKDTNTRYKGLSKWKEIERLNNDLAAARAELEEERSKHQDAKSAIDQKTKESERRAQETHHMHSQEREVYRRAIDTLEHENKALKEELQQLREGLNAEDSAILTVPQADRDGLGELLDSVQLPEKGVLFLGGHPKLLRKLRLLHPNWDYISVNDEKPVFRDNKTYNVCFYWYKYTSHSLEEFIKKYLKNDNDFIYLNSLNPELLEKEMKHGYLMQLVKHTKKTD